MKHILRLIHDNGIKSIIDFNATVIEYKFNVEDNRNYYNIHTNECLDLSYQEDISFFIKCIDSKIEEYYMDIIIKGDDNHAIIIKPNSISDFKCILEVLFNYNNICLKGDIYEYTNLY